MHIFSFPHCACFSKAFSHCRRVTFCLHNNVWCFRSSQDTTTCAYIRSWQWCNISFKYSSPKIKIRIHFIWLHQKNKTLLHSSVLWKIILKKQGKHTHETEAYTLHKHPFPAASFITWRLVSWCWQELMLCFSWLCTRRHKLKFTVWNVGRARRYFLYLLGQGLHINQLQATMILNTNDFHGRFNQLASLRFQMNSSHSRWYSLKLPGRKLSSVSVQHYRASFSTPLYPQNTHIHTSLFFCLCGGRNTHSHSHDYSRRYHPSG